MSQHWQTEYCDEGEKNRNDKTVLSAATISSSSEYEDFVNKRIWLTVLCAVSHCRTGEFLFYNLYIKLTLVNLYIKLVIIKENSLLGVLFCLKF